MSKFFRPWMALAFAVTLYSLPSFSQWGSGQYPAQPACQMQMQIGDEATSIKDELKERQEELKFAKSDLSRVKSRLSSIKTSVNAQRDLFKMTGFEGSAFNFIERHINSGSSCRDYKDSCSYYRSGVSQNDGPTQYPYWYFAVMMTERMKGNDEAYLGSENAPLPTTEIAQTEVAEDPTIQELESNARMPASDIPDPDPVSPIDRRSQPPPPPPVYRDTPVAQCSDRGVGYEGGFTAGTFLPHCAGRGEVRTSICNISDGIDSIPRGRNAASCEKYLSAWQEKKKEEAELAAEKLRLEAIVKELEVLTKIKKTELREALKDFQREQRESATEGGCLDCMVNGGAVYAPRRASIWDTVGNFALAGLSIYGGMQSSKYISDNNARLGFQSTPIPLAGATVAYGWPFIQAGLQGVLPGGMGQGGIGCAGTAFNGGQSMGPYGMAGPNGMMNPYGQNGFSPNSMWGMPQNMYGTPNGNGMFNAGFGPGFYPGYGQQNYCPAWPCPMGMNGMPGMPGMNGQGGFNPMMPGFINPGFSAGFNPGMGGFNPGMGGMGGFNPGMGGFNPGMGGMGGFNPGMGGGMDPMMNYQMQQMQQQMAMQQYNMQMQTQLRNFQNAQARQQQLTGLYSEMNNLMMRIQQTQAQMGSGGMLGFDNSFMPPSGFQGNFQGNFQPNFRGNAVVIPGQVGAPPNQQFPGAPFQNTPSTLGVPAFR